MGQFFGTSFTEFQAIENIRAILGHPSDILISGWNPETGALVTESSATSRVPAGPDMDALGG